MGTHRCDSCPHFAVLCNLLNRLPPYEEVKISKTVMQKIPECFEETLLGEPKGSLRQLRGPKASHVLEYEKEWVVHRDRVDPRYDPIGHLTNDAPYVLVLGFFAFLGVSLLIVAAGGKKK